MLFFQLFFLLSLPAPEAVAQDPPHLRNYRIGPRDLLELRVFEIPELNITQRVSQEGTLSLPILGDFQVQGLSKQKAEEKLKELLEAKYVQRATVRIEIQEYLSSPILVLGAVKNPGSLPSPGRLTLLEVITGAGGLTGSEGRYAYISRKAGNGLSDQIQIDLEELLIRSNPKLNIPVFTNDIINIPIPVEVTIFCLGEVSRSGAVKFSSDERMTLLTLIARAGGLTDKASNKILIRRRDRLGREEEFKAHYKKIIDGKEPDIELQPDDIVFVKESFF